MRIVYAAIAAAFLAGGAGLGAHAHDAPPDGATGGWTYPLGCCGEQDCAPLEAGDLRYVVTGDGTPAWLVVATGEVIPAGKTRASPDRMNHRCIYLGGESAGKTRRSVVDGVRLFCLWIATGQF